jgi:histidinol-phosphatase (PHP family)
MNLQLLTKSNLHTHTSFSDGKNTAEEVVLSAINAGMEVLGFSEHSFHPHPDIYGMASPECQQEYKQEIYRLKDIYADRIKILCGIEQDSFSGIPTDVYDYVIGSVHNLKFGDDFSAIDLAVEDVQNAIQMYCGGDSLNYAKAYFEAVAKVETDTQCDIVGHFDLLTKFNERADIFDTSDPRYIKAGLEALDALLEKDVIFEVNTGAMARGYRTTPYPAPIFLHRIAEKRGNILLSSDAHNKDRLTYGFDVALQIIKASGIGSVLTMTKNGWKNIAI